MADQPVALITGSSKGVGKGISSYLLGRGFKVFGCSRGPSTMDEKDYEHTQLDVGCQKQVSEWVSGVSRAEGRIDVLVNSAGMMPASTLALATTSDVVEETIKTNFLGTFSVCREAATVMLRKRTGRIINLSTIATGLHLEGASAYIASKSAVVAFSKVLAKELAPAGITVNVIAVSLMETEMSATLDEQQRERYREHFAIKRWATIDDVCNAVSFFASPDSGYVTGQVMHLGYVD